MCARGKANRCIFLNLLGKCTLTPTFLPPAPPPHRTALWEFSKPHWEQCRQQAGGACVKAGGVVSHALALGVKNWEHGGPGQPPSGSGRRAPSSGLRTQRQLVVQKGHGLGTESSCVHTQDLPPPSCEMWRVQPLLLALKLPSVTL